MKARYQTAQAEHLESAAESFINRGFADANSLSDDFISFADGVRFVNDFHKDDYLKVAQETTSRGDFKLEEGFYALDEDGSNSAFILLLGSTGAYPVPVIARISVDESGKVDKLWSRRGVLESEKGMLRQPKAVFARMEGTPEFVVKELAEGQKDNMLAVLDKFLKALNAKSTAERVAIVQRFTRDDFQKWEGTSVWEPMTGLQVLDRHGLVASMGALMSLGGASSGGTRVLVRGKAASSTHNLGFLHLCYLAANAEGPIALDVMLVFAFSSCGRYIKQAMGFRNAFRLQEYALAFKMDEDVGVSI